MNAVDELTNVTEAERCEWIADFDAMARRPLPVRVKYGFIHTTKPVLDDESSRVFDTLQQYRDWCERELPAWLGYGRV
jgi:hypothetical protein